MSTPPEVPAQVAQPTAELRYSLGGGTVVTAQPDERAFPLRQNDFLTLCEGEVAKSDERWRDVCIAVFFTVLIGDLSIWPTIDWGAALQSKQSAPFLSGFLLCSITLSSAVLSAFFMKRCGRKGLPSAYLRLRKRIEKYFEDGSSEMSGDAVSK